MMSKYLESMQAGVAAAGSNLTIIGSTLIVEIIERDRKTQSGIILQANIMDKGRELRECVVLAVGVGYYNEESGEETPLDTKVGDIVYVEPGYVNLLADFPIKDYKHNTIGLISEGAIKLRFSATGAEDFRKGTGALS